jgi:hypothetical protein
MWSNSTQCDEEPKISSPFNKFAGKCNQVCTAFQALADKCLVASSPLTFYFFLYMSRRCAFNQLALSKALDTAP